jgi:hypothetical protein
LADAAFAIPASIPTMVTGEELDYLHRLTREEWSGKGCVVEMGPWLGGSTWALAAGMEENPDRDPSARLHVIDNFVWQPFMQDRAPLGLAAGDSFRSSFESNLAPKQELIVVHQAALPDDESWDAVHDVGVVHADREVPVLTAAQLPSGVEVAFIDGAKSWGGLLHLMRLLAPGLTAGESLIVFQDFKDWSSFWVPLFVSALLEAAPGCLELTDVLRWNSVSFRVAHELGPLIEEAAPESLDDLTTAAGIGLLGAAADLLRGAGDPLGARICGLKQVAFLGYRGLWDRATERLLEVERTWPLSGDSLTQLERTREWVERKAGRSVRPSRRLRLIKGRRKLGRVFRRGRALLLRRY